MSIQLHPQPLTADAFKPYGEVIEADGEAQAINAGNAASFTDLANVDVADEGGKISVNIYNANARELPFKIEMLERHPLGSQAFIPMHGQRFLAIVLAKDGVLAKDEPLLAKNIKVFISNGRQGINLAKGTWHHPFFAIDGGAFLVIDRQGVGQNCEEYYFDKDNILVNEN
ncbi:MAG: ureidoglycolate lyase [Sphingomonadales bacterium]|nr:ureidoglycolate lyase [Sphingomonadales bacterium]